MIRTDSECRNPWLVGLIAFQLAIFGTFGSSANGDSISASAILSAFLQADVREGRSLPTIAAFGQSGGREWSLFRNRLTTIVFQDDCTCETEQVDRWVESAHRRNEDVVLVVNSAPQDLPRFHRKNIPSSRVLAIRQSELKRLGIGSRRMPVAVYVAAGGTVVSIQDNPLQAS